MGTAFWIRRFLVVFAIAFAVISVSHLIRGREVDYALVQAAIWSPLSAAVFTVGRFIQARRGQHCAICKDTPEMLEDYGPRA